MSSRMLWLMSILLALLTWAALFLFTGAEPFSTITLIAGSVLLALALTLTLAPLVWIAARRLRLSTIGERPAVALRVAAWVGLWGAVAFALRMARYFDWAVVLTLAAVLGLVESFLQQAQRSRKPR